MYIRPKVSRLAQRRFVVTLIVRFSLCHRRSRRVPSIVDEILTSENRNATTRLGSARFAAKGEKRRICICYYYDYHRCLVRWTERERERESGTGEKRVVKVGLVELHSVRDYKVGEVWRKREEEERETEKEREGEREREREKYRVGIKEAGKGRG